MNEAACSRCSPSDWPPKIARSLTRPLTRTRDPLLGDASALRHHRQLAGAIVYFVEPERHQRTPHELVTTPLIATVLVLIAARIVFQLRHAGSAAPANIPTASDQSERCDGTSNCSLHTASPEKIAARNRPELRGMRRCQRLPELRTPLIPRDAGDYIKARTCAVRENLQQNAAGLSYGPSHAVDALTSGPDAMVANRCGAPRERGSVSRSGRQSLVGERARESGVRGAQPLGVSLEPENESRIRAVSLEPVGPRLEIVSASKGYEGGEVVLAGDRDGVGLCGDPVEREPVEAVDAMREGDAKPQPIARRAGKAKHNAVGGAFAKTFRSQTRPRSPGSTLQPAGAPSLPDRGRQPRSRLLRSLHCGVESSRWRVPAEPTPPRTHRFPVGTPYLRRRVRRRGDQHGE